MFSSVVCSARRDNLDGQLLRSYIARCRLPAEVLQRPFRPRDAANDPLRFHLLVLAVIPRVLRKFKLQVERKSLFMGPSLGIFFPEAKFGALRKVLGESTADGSGERRERVFVLNAQSATPVGNTFGQLNGPSCNH